MQNSIFQYEALERVTNDDGTRFYTCPKYQSPIPSVTTILSATANKEYLALWEEWVGKKKADKVRKEATNLGSLVHLNIENHIQNIPRPPGNHPMRVLARSMSDQIINNSIPKITEVMGIETALYFPGLYAGTTDLVGIFDGVLTIMDHKTAKKMRTRDMIEDYFVQASAYVYAHDEIHGTSITRTAIFMVSRDLKYSEFVVEGNELAKYKDKFLRRLDDYYTKNG